MRELNRQLEEALEKEDYEEAAILRDKIEALKKLYKEFFENSNIY